MEDIIDLIFNDSGSSQVSDAIKDALYGKSAEKIDSLRPVAAASLFGNETAPIEDSGEE